MAYPPAPYQYGYPPPVKTNAMAVASLVSGIMSWLILPLVGAVVAVILGHMSRGQIKRTGEAGEGMATGGLVLGYLNLVASVLVVCFLGAVALGCAGLVGISNVDVTPTPVPTTSPEPIPTR
jgi:hypothetical protein